MIDPEASKEIVTRAKSQCIRGVLGMLAFALVIFATKIVNDDLRGASIIVGVLGSMSILAFAQYLTFKKIVISRLGE